MGDKIPIWQTRSIRTLDDLFKQQQFLQDMQRVKKREFSLAELVQKYSLDYYVAPYISKYIETGKKDISTILPPFSMVSEKIGDLRPSPLPKMAKVLMSNDVKQEKGLYLRIYAHTTKGELVEFINQNWKSELEPFIIEHFGTKSMRKKTRPNLLRDESIFRDKANGLDIKSLQEKYMLGYAEIYQILKRHKK